MIKKGFSFKQLSVSIAAIGMVFSMMQNAAAQDTAFAFVSSKGPIGNESSYWQSASVSEGGNASVTVNAGQKYQQWHGFAGTVNEAGWDALKLLSEDERNRAIHLLFDKENGIGFQWVRVPIGASDYGLDRYTLDDSPGKADDFTMQHFSIERDKGCLIQYIKAALAVKPDLKFWASPWTPPPWMKTGAADAAGYDGGNFRNEPQVMAAHALYFAKFIEAYKAEGININAVCPQNEPGYTQHYPSCGWGKTRLPDGNNDPNNGNEYLSTFVASHLKDTLANHAPNTEIWCGTLSNDAFVQDYYNGMKQKAGNVIKAAGFQWNNVSFIPTASNDGYLAFCSEHQCGNYPWKENNPDPPATSRENADATHFLPGIAPNNHAYGEESWSLIKDWITKGANMYSAWNMVLDEKGLNLDKTREWPQNALMAVNRSTKKLEVTPYYFVMRHIGQFVDSGAVRIGTNSNDALAFQNPNGSIVTIISNTGGSKQIAVSASGKTFQFQHNGQGWATLYVGPRPIKTVKDLNHNQSVKKVDGLKIATMKDGYMISLSSPTAGRVELLTPAGRVLTSRTIAKGNREVMLPKQATHTGLLIVRAVTDGGIKTAQVVAY